MKSIDLTKTITDEEIYSLSRFTDPINKFMDEMRVFHDDEKVRNNRLAILIQVKKNILRYADFRLINIKAIKK